MRAESKQEEGRFPGLLFLTLQTLLSLYLGKKFRAFPATPFNTFSYFLADVFRGQGPEAGDAWLGFHPTEQSWEGKVVGEESWLEACAPGPVWGQRTRLWKLRLGPGRGCTSLKRCLPMSCSSFGAIKGGIRASVISQHRFRERSCSSQGWRHSSALLQRPEAEQSIPGPSCWTKGWSATGPAPLVSPHIQHHLCDGDQT